MITAVVLTALVLVFKRPLLMMFGASENTLGYAESYLNIYAVGTIFVQLTLGLNAFIAAQGFSKISMMTVVIGAVTNIVLDPIFILDSIWACGEPLWQRCSLRQSAQSGQSVSFLEKIRC